MRFAGYYLDVLVKKEERFVNLPLFFKTQTLTFIMRHQHASMKSRHLFRLIKMRDKRRAETCACLRPRARRLRICVSLVLVTQRDTLAQWVSLIFLAGFCGFHLCASKTGE